MTTNNLTRYNNNGIELLINTTTGESFASVRGYSRMANKSQSTISERLNKGDELEQQKTAKILTPGGLQGVRLIDEDLICQWLPMDNPEMAIQLLKLGVRSFLHALAGFQLEPKIVKELPTVVPDNKIQKAYLEYLEKQNEDQAKFIKEIIKIQNKSVAKPNKTNSLEKIITLSRKKGWITARDVKQNIRDYKNTNSSEIRDTFKELVSLGHGGTRKENTRMQWHHFPEAEILN